MPPSTVGETGSPLPARNPESCVESRQAIKTLVQESLGCGCPEEVFGSIEIDDDAGNDGIQRIRIGGRLLLHILDAARTVNLSAAVARALQQGRSERDRLQFNRFRLIVIATEPDAVRPTAESAFAQDPHRDARTHLHVLDRRVVRSH